MTNNELLEAALEYAARDWPALSLVPGATDPLTDNGFYPE